MEIASIDLHQWQSAAGDKNRNFLPGRQRGLHGRLLMTKLFKPTTITGATTSSCSEGYYYERQAE